MKLQLPWYQAKMKNIFPLLLASNEGPTTGGLWQKGLPNVLLSSWQQLVRESPDFSSFSIEREETRLSRVYIIGVSEAPSCYHHSVLFGISPSISIRTMGWLKLLPWLVGLLFTFVGHKHVFLQEPFQDFCQFHCPFHREEVWFGFKS